MSACVSIAGNVDGLLPVLVFNACPARTKADLKNWI
jgi:hypothetical protein